MYDLTIRPSRSPGSLLVLAIFLVAVQSGCGPSAAYPKAPKIRIEGPAGTQVGYGVTYFDGKDSIDATGGVKLIPESGVYSEDLKSGHQGVLVEVIPSQTATAAVILLDGTKEIQRATAQGEKETARVKAGKPGP
jgi:hypothetical protein